MTLPAPLLFGISWMDPNWLLDQFGPEFFWISALIIFVECGLFFPFLPGDTLLVAIGLFISGGRLQVFGEGHGVELLTSILVLIVAAVLGNVTGYEIGRMIGPRLFQHDGRFLKRKHLLTTQDFFDRHGNKALVIGRFVPFVRTYITLVAGMVGMARRRFWEWSAVGAVLWVLAVTLIGYFLGTTVPWLVDKIDLVILGLLLLSVVPVTWEWWRQRRGARQQAEREPQSQD